MGARDASSKGEAETMAPLEGLRALDLTGPEGWLTGKLYADLGVEVIRVDRPGAEMPDLRTPAGARWAAYNRGKRSVTLALESAPGRDQLLALVAEARFLIESSGPGGLESLGLDYPTLAARNPGIVVVRLSPFGQEGPLAGYRSTDLILMAAGGMLYLCGDPDRPPVRISCPQFEKHMAIEGAASGLIAHYAAERTGRGQVVDVSGQLAALRVVMNATPFPELYGGLNLERTGAFNASTGTTPIRNNYACADGFVTVMIGGLVIGASTNALFDWMREEGVPLPEPLRDLDWARVKTGKMERALIEAVEAALAPFFQRHTKQEIYAQAIARRILLAPVSDVNDLLDDTQLEARTFWQKVESPTTGTSYLLPGPFAKLSRTPLASTPAAPAPGADTVAVAAELSGTAPRTLATVREPGPVEGDLRKPFEGLKVWDMSWVGVGPITARYLADYGATVVRLDSTRRPCPLRGAPPFAGKPGLNRSQFHNDFNASKLSLGLDLSSPRGREIAWDMIAWADVVTESFTPKVLQSWGMGWEAISRAFPDKILYSTCQLGQTGPRALLPGYGNLMASLSGFTAQTGWPDREPALIYGAYTDFICPRFGISAIVAALDHRRRSGLGQWIDLSQYEASLHLLGEAVAQFQITGECPRRRGNDADDAAPHGVYACRDGWVAIAVPDVRAWRRVRAFLGDPALDDPELERLEARLARRHELDARLEAATRQRDAWEITRALQPEAPSYPVHNQSALHEDPQIQSRGYFVPLDHPETGRVSYNGLASRLSRTPGELSKAAPKIGEDSRRVLTELLGYAGAAVSALIAEGVVEET